MLIFKLTTSSHESETGVTRLALSDHDREVRDWFARTTTELGCKVSIDEMGNMVAIRPGRREGPPTAAGSHLDTQPTGGRYVSITLLGLDEPELKRASRMVY